jgi:hypothetical protein
MESNAFFMMSHVLCLRVPIWPIFMLDEFPLYITRKKKGLWVSSHEENEKKMVH